MNCSGEFPTRRSPPLASAWAGDWSGGALDQRVNATEPVAKAALEKAGLVHELVTEPEANHAFFNDTGDRYNATAADDAWRRVQDWFGRYVG